MLLEARSANCCSTEFILKIDGRPVGKFEGRWFSETLDLALTGRRKLVFQKLGWMGSEFVLKREEPEGYVGHADRAGMFSSQWNLDLSCGPAELAKAGWLSSNYEIRQSGRTIGRVDRMGWCENGWRAEGTGLKEEDLMLVGLVYHTVLRRQQQAAAAHGAGS